MSENENGLMTPIEMEKYLNTLKTQRQRNAAIDGIINQSPIEAEQVLTEYYGQDPYLDFDAGVQKFTDLNRFYTGWHHALIAGRTGAGKSTLLLTMIKQFLDRGNQVLLRDDGGLEFRYLATIFPHRTRVFIPDGCDLNFKGFNCEKAYFKDAGELLDQLGDNMYPFNVVTYDVFCVDPGLAGTFYGDLFTKLIYRCMSRKLRFHPRLVFAIMELNDIVQPKGYSITKAHDKVRTLVEYNVRKLRKFNVKMIAETHRFNQISINVRSQFDYYFLKKCYGADTFQFISASLITANNKVFWAVLKKIVELPPWNFILFDHNLKFDFYRFGDIPRPDVRCTATGRIQAETKEEKLSPNAIRIMDTKIVVHKIQNKLTDPEIAKAVGTTIRRVQHVTSIMRTDETLASMIPKYDRTERKIQELEVPS